MYTHFCEAKLMIRKTVIITGGFGDIGKAIAEKFASNGYNIAMTFLNSFDNDFIVKLKGFGVDVLALRCDQTSESEIINFINTATHEFEYIDAIVCNAGKAEPEELLAEKSTGLIDEILSVNLRGTIIFNREISKYFLAQKHGSIVNISSIYGETGGSMESVYSACKGGINALTKSLATELAPNIRVNAVAPGIINTKMNNDISKEAIIYAKNQTPLARLGEPQDVANAVWFLCNEESSYITGEILTVSGGALRL